MFRKKSNEKERKERKKKAYQEVCRLQVSVNHLEDVVQPADAERGIVHHSELQQIIDVDASDLRRTSCTVVD